MGLRFPTELIPGVRDGRVTMQFGLWKRPRVVAGRVYVVKGVGIIRVTAVEKINLSRLTPWEAEAAGAVDVAQLRSWLKDDNPSADPAHDDGYRVRFRYLGPETDDSAGEGEAGDEEAEAGDADDKGSAVVAKAIPPDLMTWVGKKDWRGQHLQLLASGVWRNADDMSAEIDIDSATTRRRMGDLRKRGLVTSHRHHGYRITPEGMGALEGKVDESEGAAGTSAADWLSAKKGRGDIINVLTDGRWHNAAEIGEAMDLSVVSVQRRVAALRDRGLVESHRRRGYRLTEVGFEAIGVSPQEAATPAMGMPNVDVGAVMDTPEAEIEATFSMEEERPAPSPLPAEVLEWLERQPYRKDLMVAVPHNDYISASELSELLGESVTTLHGRLATLRDRGLIESLPRKGYTLTPLGVQAVEVISAMATRRRAEPREASDFLSAESDTWSMGGTGTGAGVTTRVRTTAARPRRQMAPGETCGFCQTTSMGTPEQGWIEAMQANLETPSSGGRGETVPCKRGVLEDGAWFLVVDRDPIAEGHCKLVCKEHVQDLVELADWSHRDQKMAHVRDTMARDLMLAIEVVSALDPRIVDVVVFSGMEHGSHLHFDLVPRYRMDLPGLRPIASSRAYYDDLSLSRKRRLWKARRHHLEEVAGQLRKVASGILAARNAHGVHVTGP
jgi:Mn-dependent DtxR family transcriptional regulator/diadenosine tetraphosphate (Ap4A) HIT family hydrolase